MSYRVPEDLFGRLSTIADIIGGKPVTDDEGTVLVEQPSAAESEFTKLALDQTGDAYVWGSGRTDEDNPRSFDCSGLVYWAARQMGVNVGGTAYNQWVQTKESGQTLSVEQALRTPGALLFSGDGTGTGRDAITHVAISLGDGRTIEARGKNYGVVIVDAATNASRFRYGGVIPGLSGGSAPQMVAEAGTPLGKGAYIDIGSRFESIKQILMGGRPSSSAGKLGMLTAPDIPGAPDISLPDISLSSDKASLQKFARSQLATAGLPDDDTEFAALVELWNRESGWNPAADNPTSTAFGIAQFLDSTWAGTGYERSTDPAVQIRAGLKYIKQRYGSARSALDFWRKRHWY